MYLDLFSEDSVFKNKSKLFFWLNSNPFKYTQIMDKAVDNLLVNTLAFILGRDSTLFYLIHDYWEEGADFRTKGYFLVDISGPMIASILMGYVLAVTIVIPQIMKNRKPYDLKKWIIAYDFLLVKQFN